MASLPRHLSPLPAERGKRSRELSTAYQRDRVLTAATEVFAKRGYRQTTVDQLVAAADSGLATFYELFEGKEDCFLQTVERFRSAGVSYVEAAQQPDLSWAEQAVHVLRGLLEYVASDPHGTRVALVEVRTAGPAAIERYNEAIADFADKLRSGREVSPFAEQLPHRLEVAVIGGVSWFLQQRAAAGRLEDVADSLPEVVRMVVGPYLGEEEAVRALEAAGATPAPPAA